MNEPLTLFTAFILGFFGSAHCLGMCGGIVGALSFNNQGKNPLVVHLGYQLGRISTYGILGLVVGFIGLWASEAHDQVGLALRWASGLMLILMGFYLAGVTASLKWIEQHGQSIWKHIQPLSKGLLPVTHAHKGYLLGMIWGLLPCGLIYSTLTWAMVSASPVKSGLLMIFFGLGNLPALLSASFFSHKINKLRELTQLRYVLGLLIALFGVWTIFAAQ